MPDADRPSVCRICPLEASSLCAWLLPLTFLFATASGCVSAAQGVRDGIPPDRGTPPATQQRAPVVDAPVDRQAPMPSPQAPDVADGGSDRSDGQEAILADLGGVVVDDALYLLTSPARIDARSALILGTVAAGIGGLMLVDEDLQDFAQRNRSQAGNDASQTLEDIGSVEAVFGGNLVLIGTGWWFRDTKPGDKLMHAALVSLEAQLFTEAVAGIGKFAFGRSRPSEGRGSNFYEPFNDFDFDRTFPSSHAARAFAVASVFATYYDQPVPLLAYSAATVMGLSRIFLNDHFASDVFAGAALGLAVGKALSWRHSLEDRRLAVLPYVAGGGGGLGITLEYRF